MYFKNVHSSNKCIIDIYPLKSQILETITIHVFLIIYIAQLGLNLSQFEIQFHYSKFYGNCFSKAYLLPIQ